MSTISTLTLHLGDGSVSPYFSISTDSSNCINYTVGENEQVTLPDYNMIVRDGFVLGGWSISTVSPQVPVFTRYFEPTDNCCDLYPVWVDTRQLGLKTAAVKSVIGTVTTVTGYDNLGTDDKTEADAAINAFTTMIAAEVGPIAEIAVGSAIDSDIEDLISEQVSVVVGSIARDVVDEATGTINKEIADLKDADDFILGSVNYISSKINDYDPIITEISESDILGTIQSLQNKVESNSQSITSLNEFKGVTISSVTAVISSITELEEADVEIMGSLTEFSSALSIATGTMAVTVSSVQNLEQGNTAILGSIDEISATLSIATSDINNLQDSVQTLEQGNTAILGSIGEISAALSTVTFDINSLQDSMGVTISSVLELEGLNGQVEANTTAIGSLQIGIGTLEPGTTLSDSITSLAAQIADIGTMSENLLATIGTWGHDGVTISDQIGALGGQIADIGTMAENLQATIGTWGQGGTTISEYVSELGTQVSNISTAWVKDIVSDSTESIINQVTYSSMFVVGTTKAVCTVVPPSNAKTKIHLKDYQGTSSYQTAFASLGTIAWYNNGAMIQPSTPVAGGSTLIGAVVTTSQSTLFALPVIEDGIENVSVGTGDGKAASGYGSTRVYAGEKVFDSRKSYNPAVTAEFGNGFTLEAVPKEGCWFDGWYEVTSVGSIVTNPGEYGKIADGYITKDTVLDVTADGTDVKYGALFRGEPAVNVCGAIDFVTIGTPYGCLLPMSFDMGEYFESDMDVQLGYLFSKIEEDESLSDLIAEPSNWQPAGGCFEYTGGEFGSCNTVLVITEKPSKVYNYIDGTLKRNRATLSSADEGIEEIPASINHVFSYYFSEGECNIWIVSYDTEPEHAQDIVFRIEATE